MAKYVLERNISLVLSKIKNYPHGADIRQLMNDCRISRSTIMEVLSAGNHFYLMDGLYFAQSNQSEIKEEITKQAIDDQIKITDQPIAQAKDQAPKPFFLMSIDEINSIEARSEKILAIICSSFDLTQDFPGFNYFSSIVKRKCIDVAMEKTTLCNNRVNAFKQLLLIEVSEQIPSKYKRCEILGPIANMEIKKLVAEFSSNIKNLKSLAIEEFIHASVEKVASIIKKDVAKKDEILNLNTLSGEPVESKTEIHETLEQVDKQQDKADLDLDSIVVDTKNTPLPDFDVGDGQDFTSRCFVFQDEKIKRSHSKKIKTTVRREVSVTIEEAQEILKEVFGLDHIDIVRKSKSNTISGFVLHSQKQV